MQKEVAVLLTRGFHACSRAADSHVRSRRKQRLVPAPLKPWRGGTQLPLLHRGFSDPLRCK